MKCERCGGLRLWFHFVNRRKSSGWWQYDGWLCMNCGEIIDPLILMNRHTQRAMTQSGTPRSFGGKVVWVRQRDAVA
ncbi:MAG TPA: hypothetical protein VFS39_14890 [Nitrospira sp.]|nr:hypothetical protein [Nitrospira sp.]